MKLKETYRKFGKGKTLKELINYVKIPKEKIDEPLNYSFEHFYNPLHLYCRLKELGIEKKIAREIEKDYELYVYKRTIKEIKKA